VAEEAIVASAASASAVARVGEGEGLLVFAPKRAVRGWVRWAPISEEGEAEVGCEEAARARRERARRWWCEAFAVLHFFSIVVVARRREEEEARNMCVWVGSACVRVVVGCAWRAGEEQSSGA
jgi:hypothetical protein